MAELRMDLPGEVLADLGDGAEYRENAPSIAMETELLTKASGTWTRLS